MTFSPKKIIIEIYIYLIIILSYSRMSKGPTGKEKKKIRKESYQALMRNTIPGWVDHTIPLQQMVNQYPYQQMPYNPFMQQLPFQQQFPGQFQTQFPGLQPQFTGLQTQFPGQYQQQYLGLAQQQYQYPGQSQPMQPAQDPYQRQSTSEQGLP